MSMTYSECINVLSQFLLLFLLLLLRFFCGGYFSAAELEVIGLGLEREERKQLYWAASSICIANSNLISV